MKNLRPSQGKEKTGLRKRIGAGKGYKRIVDEVGKK